MGLPETMTIKEKVKKQAAAFSAFGRISLLAAALLLTACGSGAATAALPNDAETEPTPEPIMEDAISTEKTEEPVQEMQDSGALQPEQAGIPLDEVQRVAAEQDCACAVIFLGGGSSIEEVLETADLSAFGYVQDIPQERYISALDGGSEVYCIVPAKGATLAINEWVCNEDNGYVGQTGQVLYRSDEDAPVLLLCNVSDIIPNTQLVMTTAQGNVLDWNPSLSLQDGTVNTPWSETAGVWDLTAYEKAPFEGWWSALARGEDGQALSLTLWFKKAGNELYYSYGPGNAMPFAEYGGSWMVLNDQETEWDAPRQIQFTLYSQTEGMDNINGTFQVSRLSNGELEVTHLDGDPLLSSLMGRTLVFDSEG